MSLARCGPPWRVLLFCLAPWLTLAPLPEAAGAAHHTVYDRLSAGDIDLSRSVLQDVLENQRSQQMRMWSSDTTGVSGSVMPLRTFKIKTGHFCRDYREAVIADGRMESRDATACRTNDGIWIPIEN